MGRGGEGSVNYGKYMRKLPLKWIVSIESERT